MKEYAETLENEVTENVNLRHQIEAVHNYLRSIVESSRITFLTWGPTERSTSSAASRNS
jgi:hypothetical protein